MDLFTMARATGLYDPRPGTNLFCELSALEAGFGLIRAALDGMRGGGSLETASRARLEACARLLGLRVPEGTADGELRRALGLLLVSPGPRTPKELGALAEALGARLTLTELPGRLLVEGELGGFLPDAAALERVLAPRLPAQTAFVFSLGDLTWDLIDRSQTDCAALDAADFTWDWFDLYGHRLFA